MFKQFGIHQKAIPEPLQEMENQAFLTVKKTEAQEIAIEKVEERPYEKWNTTIKIIFDPTSGLRLRSAQRGYKVVFTPCARAFIHHIENFPIGVFIVFISPERKVLVVLVYDVGMDFNCVSTAQNNMFIHP